MVKKKYSRTDEKHHYWTVSSLINHPVAKKQPFYPVSDFAVFKSLKQMPKPIIFPDNLLISPNYFFRGWSLNTHRRIKNVIVVMEWYPSKEEVLIETIELLTRLKKDKIRALTAEQETLLRKAFELFDVNNSQDLDTEEVKAVLRALNAFEEDEQELSDVLRQINPQGKAVLSFEDVKRMMTYNTFSRNQTGRYWVILSLQEAESVRGWIHLQRFSPLLKDRTTAIGLRTGSYLLDGSFSYTPAHRYQQETSEALLRFIDSDIFYTDPQMDLLLHSLQINPVLARQEWFDEIRSCRRRQQIPWQKTSLTRLFTMADEYQLLVHKARISRISALITKKNMLMMDAFRAFDADRDGRLNCSELYAGICWLGLDLTPDDIYDIVRAYDSDKDGCLSYLDFSSTFKNPDAEAHQWLEGRSETGEEFINIDIPPKPIRELYDVGKEKKFEKRDIPPGVLEKLKVKIKKVPQFDKIWTSEGTNSRAKVSVWSVASQLTFLDRKNKIRACLGHYAVAGWQDPIGDKKVERMTIEFTDTATFSLSQSRTLEWVIYQLIPHPVKYQQVWHQELGATTFFAWKPIPPSPDYVAIGMIGTTSAEEPPVEMVRCIPRRWVIPSKYEPKLIWEDSGAGGKKGSMWLINSLELMAVTEGHLQPKGPFWELFKPRFMASEGMALADPLQAQKDRQAEVEKEKAAAAAAAAQAREAAATPPGGVPTHTPPPLPNATPRGSNSFSNGPPPMPAMSPHSQLGRSIPVSAPPGPAATPPPVPSKGPRPSMPLPPGTPQSQNRSSNPFG